MSGFDYPIKHFRLMLDLSLDLKGRKAQLVEHEYLYRTFGSWWVVMLFVGERFRLLFDGKEFRLVLERNNVMKKGPIHWEEFATKDIVNNSNPTLDEIIEFLNVNLPKSND